MSERIHQYGNSANGAFLAVTIGVGPVWRLMAELAAESVRRRTGLETRILGEEAMRKYEAKAPIYLKSRLFEEFPEAEHILYFDADMVFCQEWDPREFAGRRELVCVRDRWDHGVVQRDAGFIGFRPDEYFNAGFFLANRTHHAVLLERSRWEQERYGTDLYEQTDLNSARHLLSIPALFLPKTYNHHDFDLLPDASHVVCGHFFALEKEPLPVIERTYRRWIDGGCGRYAPNVWPDIDISEPNSPTGFAHMAAERAAIAVARADSAPPNGAERAHASAEAEHRALLEAAVENLPPFPAEHFAGRGIVICGGGPKYFPCLWVCIRMLRQLGCTLPIEVWHLGPREMSVEMAALLAPYDVACIDGRQVRLTHPVRLLQGWEMKAFSLLHTRFAEVLLLDADNVPVLDPTFLFDDPAYREKGAVFWPDFGRLAPERAIWRITGIPYRDEPEFESGQILVDKTRCWSALALAMHFNEYSDFYYRHVHGDKETFHLAWRKLGLDYAMPDRGLYALTGTMCQHDLQGRRLFQHRNTDKWRLDGSNRRIFGFQYEEECRGFLAGLRTQWTCLPVGVRRWNPARKTEAERAAAEQLCSGPWRYRRQGQDERALTFLPTGGIGEGTQDRERHWDVRAVGDRLFVEIFAHHEKTLAAELTQDGIWRGRWVVYEQMPVELLPLADDGVIASPSVADTAITQGAPTPKPAYFQIAANKQH